MLRDEDHLFASKVRNLNNLSEVFFKILIPYASPLKGKGGKVSRNVASNHVSHRYFSG